MTQYIYRHCTHNSDGRAQNWLWLEMVVKVECTKPNQTQLYIYIRTWSSREKKRIDPSIRKAEPRRLCWKAVSFRCAWKSALFSLIHGAERGALHTVLNNNSCTHDLISWQQQQQRLRLCSVWIFFSLVSTKSQATRLNSVHWCWRMDFAHVVRTHRKRMQTQSERHGGKRAWFSTLANNIAATKWNNDNYSNWMKTSEGKKNSA